MILAHTVGAELLMVIVRLGASYRKVSNTGNGIGLIFEIDLSSREQKAHNRCRVQLNDRDVVIALNRFWVDTRLNLILLPESVRVSLLTLYLANAEFIGLDKVSCGASKGTGWLLVTAAQLNLCANHRLLQT